MSAGRLAIAAAVAVTVGASALAWHTLAPGPAPGKGRNGGAHAPSAATPAEREADDILAAVRRGRLGAALAGVDAFLRKFDPRSLDDARREGFDAARLDAGRWGLVESESLLERGEAEAAEAILRRACAALAGTEGEAEAAAAAARVRRRVEALAAEASATAEKVALGPVEATVASARAKAAAGAPAAALAEVLAAIEGAKHPAARARLEKEAAALRRSVRESEARAALRKRADEAIQRGDYATARRILTGLGEAAGVEVPEAEAAKDKAKLEGLKDLEENRETEALAALRKALRWMAKQQLSDGSFSIPATGDDGKEVPEETRKKAPHRAGITGLAALALLGHVRHDVTDEFEPSLDRALAWLLAAQQPDGSYARGSGKNLYEHSIATLVLVEADRVLRKPGMREPAQKAIAWLQDAQGVDGGWRYQPRVPQSDVSVTGWAMQALLHARHGGYEIRPGVVENAFTYLDRMTDPVTKRTAYMVPGGGNPSMTAVALFCRLRDSRGPEDDSVRLAADYLLLNLPGSSALKNSSYATFYASDGMSRLGGAWWKKWSPALKKTLLDSQNKKGGAEGSWPSAQDAWAKSVGAVYQAAMNSLSLENFFEHRE